MVKQHFWVLKLKIRRNRMLESSPSRWKGKEPTDRKMSMSKWKELILILIQS